MKTPIKVACIGNMNNNFFSLVRHLRDSGNDAHLLLFDDTFDHFTPSCDSYEPNYNGYTHQLKWGNPPDFPNVDAEDIKEALKNYDITIGCGLAPAYLNKAGIILDICVPYGLDLYRTPFQSDLVLNKDVHRFLKIAKSLLLRRTYPKDYMVYRHQKMGIRHSRMISTQYLHFSQELSKIKPEGEVCFLGFPIIYTPEYSPEKIQRYMEQSSLRKKFMDIRKNNDLVIHHHSRHVWKDQSNNQANKRNDLLIKGYSNFLKKNNNVKACLVLYEYGSDVDYSKRLITQLGINEHVSWMPLADRKDIMVGLHYSDIGTGHFVGGYVGNGVTQEVMAMGKPLMFHQLEPTNKHILLGESPPIVNVRSEQEIARVLQDYIARPEYYQSIGEAGKKWIHKYTQDSIMNFNNAINNLYHKNNHCN